MFSEELSGNASRKRAEENRARRRQLLKEQQKQQQQQQAAKNKITAAAAAASPDGTPQPTPTLAALATNSTSATLTKEAASGPQSSTASSAPSVPPPSAAASTSSALSVVERAEQQRQIRAQIARRTGAAVKVQSFVRSYTSNLKLRSELWELLDKRLRDLKTLRDLLSSSTKTTSTITNSLYIPPVATTTALVRQLLFVTRTIPYRRNKKQQALKQPQQTLQQQRLLAASTWNVSLFHPLLEYCLLPGLLESTITTEKGEADSNKNPNSNNALLSWMEEITEKETLSSSDYSQSRRIIHRRLEGLLRLAVTAAFSPTLSTSSSSSLIDDKTDDAVLKFLRLVMGCCGSSSSSSPSLSLSSSSLAGGRRKQQQYQRLVRHCRSVILPKVASEYFGAPSLSSTTVSLATSTRKRAGCSSGSSRSTSLPSSSLALSSSPWAVVSGSTTTSSSLDLIACLRYHLLFVVSPLTPIPANAKDLREACISERAKTLAGTLFRLVLDGVNNANTISSLPERQLLHCRIVTDLLTVPLLSWKVGPVAVRSLVLVTTAKTTTDNQNKETNNNTNNNESFPLLLRLLHSFVELHSETLAASSTTGGLFQLLVNSNKDVSLSTCPATPMQCLLANLVQLGCLQCPTIHGGGGSGGSGFSSTTDSAPCSLNVSHATFFFTVVATVLDAIPLGTFSSRDSTVEWMVEGGGGGHLTPIVLSSVILEHCKLLLLDSFVRRLFYYAITSMNKNMNNNTNNVDAVLAQRNDRDLKHERDLLESGGGGAASSLAAKEARIDRNRSFWNSSKWARKITKGVSSLLSSTSATTTSYGDTTAVVATTNAQQQQNSSSSSLNLNSNGHNQATLMMNTSSVSRKLAGGGEQHSVSSSTRQLLQQGRDDSSYTSINNNSPELFLVLCRMYAIVLARWGGGGHEDIVRKRGGGAGAPSSSSSNAAAATNDLAMAATKTPETCTLALLNVLGFSTQIVKASWAMIQSNSAIRSDVDSLVDADRGSRIVRAHSLRPLYASVTISRRNNNNDAPQIVSEGDGAVLLYMFAATLAHVLIVTDDVEIHDMDRPLPVHQIRRSVELLKKLLYRACYIDVGSDDHHHQSSNCSRKIDSQYFGLAIISASSRVMRDLYDRSSRRPICVPKLWLVPDLFEKEIRQCKTHGDYVSLLSLPVLRICPFLVSFKRRLKIFERIVTTNRIEMQGVNDMNPFNPNPLKPGIPVRITRGRLLEDGLATMNHLGSNMRRRIAVQYVNEAGVQEAGIDAGGLFKEFWTDLSGIAFNPNYALFRVAEGTTGNCLYPNPSSGAAHGTDTHITLFEFLGRILGKALYEGITIHPRFAHFFLSFLRGDYNYLHMLPDLSTVDPQLYNNLMFLKTFDGDASDLCLTFTITNDEFGGTKEISLIPNGANVEVTNSNKQRYIGLVAKYYVVDRVKEQSEAFTRGLWEVIDRSWLRIFNEPELQVLISGASDGKIDVEDMRANTKYLGGYTGLDRNISRFWSVVASMDSQQQQGLLRFVTSCERPPPLGFASMNPSFTIQRVGITWEDGKLPTASTCFNTLKLPIYSSDKVMKERLLYAIQSGTGFELT